MRTLHLPNVPDDVVERLERLAARSGTSLDAFVVRELADLSRRADHPAVLGALPHLGVGPGTIVDALDAERDGR